MRRHTLFQLIVSCWLTLIVNDASGASSSLDQAIRVAIESDPVLARHQAEVSAFQAESTAAGELPDPRLSLSVANLPVDTFSFSQEPMTRINIGLSQRIPGGGRRDLAAGYLARQGAVVTLESASRVAAIRRAVTGLWIEAAEIDETIRLVEESRGLFEQLRDVTRARYDSATRGVSQQDVIRAEVEISRLDERLFQLAERRARIIGRLAQWLPGNTSLAGMEFELPQAAGPVSPLSTHSHPEVQAADQRIAAARQALELARSNRSPDWHVQTSYGYRNSDFSGRNLPDFFTVGISVDLPSFRGKRRDSEVEAAASRVAAMESARLLTLRKLDSQLQEMNAAINRLEAQLALYEETLLAQSEALSRSALAAYQADEGDFADVIRAYVSRLGARVDAIGVRARKQHAINELHYLKAAANAEPEETR